MKIFLALFIIPFLLFIAVIAFLWSGSYDVSASIPHWVVTHWLLGKVRDRSIAVHSKSITPPSLDNQKLVDIGFKEYHEMCRFCHGAPGYSRTEIAKGLYPAPPVFSSKDMKMRNDAELYWVIKNGIKMTGMPAFSSTHEEQEIWGIVAFFRRLPDLKPDQYGSMVKEARGHGEPESDHLHRNRK